MHSTLHRPHPHTRQPQPPTSTSISATLPVSSSPSSLSSSNGGKAAAAVYRRAEDSDNIDDILGSLWPTGSATPYLPQQHQRQSQGSRPPSAQSQLTNSILSSGQCTPPEDATWLYSHQVADHSDPGSLSEYTLVAPPATATAPSASSQSTSGCVSNRLFSTSIQIGDPEWRIDSPQSMARPLHHMPKLPSPVSPITPAAIHHCHSHRHPVDSCDAGGAQTRRRPLLPNLGLALPPAQRIQASTRSVTLGSACHPPQPLLPTRVVTPAERVARLHTVSGLAARAVARRCMSAHSSVLPAGLSCVEEPALPVDWTNMTTATATSCKPTFADIAKGGQGTSAMNL
ncbi:hypothetical protein GGI20_001511 [Coemansia sp. BCRC 34301]|nr:hypothetical protein GGI20_001511 [Coemansia sp. BCRC 34301]